jgi:hypothetical protein
VGEKSLNSSERSVFIKVTILAPHGDNSSSPFHLTEDTFFNDRAVGNLDHTSSVSFADEVPLATSNKSTLHLDDIEEHLSDVSFGVIAVKDTERHYLFGSHSFESFITGDEVQIEVMHQS